MQSDAGYELFDHTADLGLRMHGPTQAALIPPATTGLYAIIGSLVPGRGNQPVSLEFTGDAAELLLRDYLAELLARFEQHGEILTAPRVVEFTSERLVVDGTACPVDQDESALDREVKAITYYDLNISRTPSGYQATVVVDI